RLTGKFAERFANDSRLLVDLRGLMRGGEESGFELRGRKIDSSVETVVEKARKPGEIAPLRTQQIGHRIVGKEEAEHRTDAMKNGGRACIFQRFSHRLFELHPEFFELAPAVDSLQLAQLGQP